MVRAVVDLFEYLSAEKKRLIHEVIELGREEKYANVAVNNFQHLIIFHNRNNQKAFYRLV